MAKENEILEFEDLLKEAHQQQKNKGPEKTSRCKLFYSTVYLCLNDVCFRLCDICRFHGN